jgi:hypothetical protein
MKILAYIGVAVACSAAALADDFATSTAQCIGLDDPGMKRCIAIIARHNYGALPKLRTFTLAEKTAIDAVMVADPKAVIVVMPDGSFVIGQTVADRLIGIPCEANPCPSP